jgi:hypothetical protein
MSTICRTLESLLAQDYGDLRVHLHLSREPYLLDEGVPDLPQSLIDLKRAAGDRLNIVYCPNIGPYRKLLPYLQRHWGESRLVVTSDDDTIYPPDWLTGLVQAYAFHRCSVAYRGHRMSYTDAGFTRYRSWMKSTIEENPSQLILPTGKDGILYDTAFFGIDVLNVAEAVRLAPTADDLWLRWHLARNGVAVYVIRTDYTDSFEETGYESSLYLNYNRGGNNDRAIADLDAYFRKQHQFGLIPVVPK